VFHRRMLVRTSGLHVSICLSAPAHLRSCLRSTFCKNGFARASWAGGYGRSHTEIDRIDLVYMACTLGQLVLI
jgi:hypothetical protein